jgi:hypothetical protein
VANGLPDGRRKERGQAERERANVEKRNEEGQIEFQGVYYGSYPDIACRGLQKFYTPVYSVRFEGKDIWGEEFVDPRSVIYADVFEPYIKLA